MENEQAVIKVIETETEQSAAASMTPATLVRRYEAIRQLVAERVLVEGIDYGVIPGTGDKPVLLKPGAEKLAAFFGLSVELELVDKIERWEPENGFFYYRYRAVVTTRDGRNVSSEASANSLEKSYRWRMIRENEYNHDTHGPAERIERRSKYGRGTYVVYKVENRDPFSLVNSIQKKGQKRAFVGSVLLATGASAFFTQDPDYFTQDAPDVEDGKAASAFRSPHAQRSNSPTPQQRGITAALEKKVIEKLKSIGWNIPPGDDDEEYQPFLAWLIGREEPIETGALTIDEANNALTRIVKEGAGLIDAYFQAEEGE